MAKIVVFDPYMGKFTADMVAFWEKQGHLVQLDRYYDPVKADWADIVWFDTCDNNILSATNPGEAILPADQEKAIPWDLHEMDLTKKKIVCRPIDIEVWLGHHTRVNWDVVNNLIFIAPHIKDIMLLDTRPEEFGIQVDTIPCAVDLNRYPFQEREKGFNIAIVSERWISKGTDLLLQIMYKMKFMDSRYKFFWLGKWSGDHWDKNYFEDFVKHNELPLEVTDWIEGDDAVNKFLEGKNYLLHGSHKEAFSYATAEAMAKGIKPVLHRFYGADELWPGLPTWTGIDEAINMITEDRYDSHSYRNYLISQGFTIPQMMEKINKVLDI